MNLKERADLVDTVGTALTRGEHTLNVLPDLIRRLLQEDAWREFETKMGTHVTYTRFEDFVAAKPLAGLGANIDLVKRIVKDDKETSLLLRETLKRPSGTNQYTEGSYNITTLIDRGTSQSYSLEVLKDKRPDMFKRVQDGEMSVNAAMIKAGLRNPKISIRLDDSVSAAKTLLTHASPEFLEELKRLLNNEGRS